MSAEPATWADWVCTVWGRCWFPGTPGARDLSPQDFSSKSSFHLRKLWYSLVRGSFILHLWYWRPAFFSEELVATTHNWPHSLPLASLYLQCQMGSPLKSKGPGWASTADGAPFMLAVGGGQKVNSNFLYPRQNARVHGRRPEGRRGWRGVEHHRGVVVAPDITTHEQRVTNMVRPQKLLHGCVGLLVGYSVA